MDQQERLAAQLGVSRAVAIRRAVAAMLGEAALASLWRPPARSHAFDVR